MLISVMRMFLVASECSYGPLCVPTFRSTFTFPNQQGGQESLIETGAVLQSPTIITADTAPPGYCKVASYVCRAPGAWQMIPSQ